MLANVIQNDLENQQLVINFDGRYTLVRHIGYQLNYEICQGAGTYPLYCVTDVIYYLGDQQDNGYADQLMFTYQPVDPIFETSILPSVSVNGTNILQNFPSQLTERNEDSNQHKLQMQLGQQLDSLQLYDGKQVTKTAWDITIPMKFDWYSQALVFGKYVPFLDRYVTVPAGVSQYIPIQLLPSADFDIQDVQKTKLKSQLLIEDEVYVEPVHLDGKLYFNFFQPISGQSIGLVSLENYSEVIQYKIISDKIVQIVNGSTIYTYDEEYMYHDGYSVILLNMNGTVQQEYPIQYAGTIENQQVMENLLIQKTDIGVILFEWANQDFEYTIPEGMSSIVNVTIHFPFDVVYPYDIPSSELPAYYFPYSELSELEYDETYVPAINLDVPGIFTYDQMVEQIGLVVNNQQVLNQIIGYSIPQINRVCLNAANAVIEDLIHCRYGRKYPVQEEFTDVQHYQTLQDTQLYTFSIHRNELSTLGENFQQLIQMLSQLNKGYSQQGPDQLLLPLLGIGEYTDTQPPTLMSYDIIRSTDFGFDDYQSLDMIPNTYGNFKFGHTNLSRTQIVLRDNQLYLSQTSQPSNYLLDTSIQQSQKQQNQHIIRIVLDPSDTQRFRMLYNMFNRLCSPGTGNAILPMVTLGQHVYVLLQIQGQTSWFYLTQTTI